jgi:lysozyme
MTTRASGIDISHHRGFIDWGKVVASGQSFGITKATEGSSFVDSRFEENWVNMRRAGIIRGAYHFYRPAIDPIKQANHFLDRVGHILHHTDLPPILDCEAHPSYVREEFDAQSLNQRLTRVRAWLEAVRQATGRLPILYTNPATWLSVLNNDKTFTGYPLWIAHYGVSKPSVPAENWGGRGWTLWQTTWEAAVPGVNNGAPPTDLNQYIGDAESLNRSLARVGPRPAAPAVTNGEMLNALSLAAQVLELNLQDWLNLLELAYLAKQPARAYDGPAWEEFPLPQDQIDVIRAMLEETNGPDPVLPRDFTNQDMINAVYKAAEMLEMAGWQFLTRANLTHLIDARPALYVGPLPAAMTSLNPNERHALEVALGLADPDAGNGGQDDPDPDGATYPEKTNQMMINALYKAAEKFGIPGWNLVVRAGLVDLVNDRATLYTGPRIETIDSLNPNEQAAVAEALGVARDAGVFDTPYPGLLNQDMINVFYAAARVQSESGWDWILRCGLEYMARDQATRYAPYQGPLIEELPVLDESEKTLLAVELTNRV